jgi:hypothetical protein
MINYVKVQRFGWFGHINRMPETGIVKKLYKWKPFTGRPVGRPKSRWEDDVSRHFCNMVIGDQENIGIARVPCIVSLQRIISTSFLIS